MLLVEFIKQGNFNKRGERHLVKSINEDGLLTLSNGSKITYNSHLIHLYDLTDAQALAKLLNANKTGINQLLESYDIPENIKNYTKKFKNKL